MPPADSARGMATSLKVEELDRLQRGVGDLHEELRREDLARTPTAAEEYLKLREGLIEQAGVVEREALKLSVGGTKAMSADAFRSLLEGAHGALRDLTATARQSAASVADTLRAQILSEIGCVPGRGAARGGAQGRRGAPGPRLRAA